MNESAQYLRTACLAWEKLRLVYNMFLVVEYLMIPLHIRLYVAEQTAVNYLLLYSLCVVVANGFYCLGPLLEIYTCAILGRQIGRGRYILFATGCIFSIIWMGGPEIVRELAR